MERGNYEEFESGGFLFSARDFFVEVGFAAGGFVSFSLDVDAFSSRLRFAPPATANVLPPRPRTAVPLEAAAPRIEVTPTSAVRIGTGLGAPPPRPPRADVAPPRTTAGRLPMTSFFSVEVWSFGAVFEVSLSASVDVFLAESFFVSFEALLEESVTICFGAGLDVSCLSGSLEAVESFGIDGSKPS